MQHNSNVKDVDFSYEAAAGWLKWYESLLLRRYGITKPIAYFEPPRAIVARLLNSFPELMSADRGSAQRFVDRLCVTCLSTSSGKILGVRHDTIRREYDRYKKVFFSYDIMQAYKGWYDIDGIEDVVIIGEAALA